MEQQRFQSEMDSLQRALEAKEAQMQRVVSGSGQVAVLKQHYDRVLTDLSSERDQLQKERTELLQVRPVHETLRCCEALLSWKRVSCREACRGLAGWTCFQLSHFP